jgi:hypothetical protein
VVPAARPLLLLLLAGSLAAQDPAGELAELQPGIDKAIDRGVQWLLRDQLRDGSWGYHQAMYPSGTTALCAYTLIKSGLPPTHSAVRRALLYLEGIRPQETYAATCQILALLSSGDQSYLPRIQQIAEDLIRWQQDGVWSYPRSHAGSRWDNVPGIRDLSNTQYAALGLRAAQQAGVKIPAEVWVQLAMQTQRFQEKESAVALPIERGKTGSPKQEAAGFRYRNTDRQATGSMTAAGVAILQICKEMLGKRLDGPLEVAVQRGIELGINWLAVNFSVTKSHNGGWLYYYLYGLERVGGLLGTDRIGPHPWYLPGARELVKRQGRDGNWFADDNEPDTCFAILFLKRATAARTGGADKRTLHVADNPRSEVKVRGTGGDSAPLELWITGFGDQVRRDLAGDDRSPVPGVRVAKVEWLVDDTPVATLPGHPGRAWQNEAYGLRHTFQKRGRYKVQARVSVVEPEAPKDAAEPVSVVESQVLTVDAGQVHEDWMDAAARARGRNLVVADEVTVVASSVNSGGQAGQSAVDGLQVTAWCSKNDDHEPALTLTFEKAVRADLLVLSSINNREEFRGAHDRILRVSLRVNGGKPVEHDLAEDELRPTTIPLGSAVLVRKLEIAVASRAKGKRWPGHCGFAEIALEWTLRNQKGAK